MIRLAVRCSKEDSESVLAALLDLAPNGVEEDLDGEFVEFAIYGAPGEVPDLGAVEAASGSGLVEVTTTEIPDDWADRWTDFHRPVEVADRLRVRPSWFEREGDWEDVVIDPGRAFGTGAHATTRMCLELLVSLQESGEATGSIADWGAGSGVLAIAAARLGWSPVAACDSEEAAIEATEANAKANAVEVSAIRINVREESPPSASTVVANLTAPLLSACARWIEEPPRVMACSGLLVSELDGAAAMLSDVGLYEAQRRTSGDWGALLLRSDRASTAT